MLCAVDLSYSFILFITNVLTFKLSYVLLKTKVTIRGLDISVSLLIIEIKTLLNFQLRASISSQNCISFRMLLKF